MKKLADRSKEVIIHKRTLFGTVGRWPLPLNGVSTVNLTYFLANIEPCFYHLQTNYNAQQC